MSEEANYFCGTCGAANGEHYLSCDETKYRTAKIETVGQLVDELLKLNRELPVHLYCISDSASECRLENISYVRIEEAWGERVIIG